MGSIEHKLVYKHIVELILHSLFNKYPDNLLSSIFKEPRLLKKIFSKIGPKSSFNGQIAKNFFASFKDPNQAIGIAIYDSLMEKYGDETYVLSCNKGTQDCSLMLMF